MKKKLTFAVKQLLKMLLQNAVLPLTYRFWRLVYRGREPELIIFADAHHSTLPFSMERIHAELIRRGYTPRDEIYDFGAMSQLRSALVSVRFMRLYAQAKYVFICDNFLPVSSCRKSEKTTVIQLWHACGLFKKMGYDTPEDIPPYYHGSVYRNYDLLTASDPHCEGPYSGAMGLEPGVVRALGVSRTDVYFDDAWLAACRKAFYEKHPEARGKKIILWAPTFRGNAGAPYQVGMEDMAQLEKQLGDGYFLIRKVHPHIDHRLHLSSTDIPTEQLLPVADLMITDYSTVLTEFLFFERPYVLFAPDLAEYQEKRGFYVEYNTLSPYVVTEGGKLREAIMEALAHMPLDWIRRQRAYHASRCDGHATARILDTVGLTGTRRTEESV